MSKLEIKKLKPGNLVYVKQFNKLRPLSIDLDKLNKFVDNNHNLCYFALYNEQVIGLAWGYILERFDNENMLYIHSVDVLETFRNKGVGKMLIEAFLNYAKNHHFRNTFLITDKGNIAANKLYNKFTNECEEDKVLYVYK